MIHQPTAQRLNNWSGSLVQVITIPLEHFGQTHTLGLNAGLIDSVGRKYILFTRFEVDFPEM